MNSRDRVFKTLRHEEPDYVPLTDHIYMKKSLENILGERGVSTQTPDKYVKVHRILGLDIINAFSSEVLQPPSGYQNGQTYIDKRKIMWKVKDGMSWYLQGMLKNLDEIKEFEVPNPEDPKLYQTIKGIVKLVKDDLAIAGFPGAPFSDTWMSIGFEEWVKLSYSNSDLLSNFIDKFTRYSIDVGKRLIDEGVDIIWISDDYGYVKGPLVNPKTYRRLIFPKVKSMINAFKKRGVPVFLHSDGNLMPIFDDLVDIGFDAIHPLERRAGMNIKTLKETYGDKITLIGNVDSLTLQTGPLDKIETQVSECLKTAAHNGGYILASDHSIHEGVPPENVKYMFMRARKLGKYPIMKS